MDIWVELAFVPEGREGDGKGSLEDRLYHFRAQVLSLALSYTLLTPTAGVRPGLVYLLASCRP